MRIVMGCGSCGRSVRIIIVNSIVGIIMETISMIKMMVVWRRRSRESHIMDIKGITKMITVMITNIMIRMNMMISRMYGWLLLYFNDIDLYCKQRHWRLDMTLFGFPLLSHLWQMGVVAYVGDRWVIWGLVVQLRRIKYVQLFKCLSIINAAQEICSITYFLR